jgi:hypothetical protein
VKLVTFAKPLAPFGVGDTRLVPDDMAVDLQGDGYLSAAEPWPAPAIPKAPEKPKRPALQPTRPAGKPNDQRMVR